MEPWMVWLRNTGIAQVMHSSWAWPAAESVHFLGLSMLMGTVGLFDLRLLGFAKHIPLPAMHRLIPWGIAGYVLNAMTGASFFIAEPDQYAYNPSFQIKILLMSLAGLNVMAFYLTMFRHIRNLGPGENAPLPARFMGGASLIFWIGVMACGRLLTFFRPPIHSCPWC